MFSSFLGFIFMENISSTVLLSVLVINSALDHKYTQLSEVCVCVCLLPAGCRGAEAWIWRLYCGTSTPAPAHKVFERLRSTRPLSSPTEDTQKKLFLSNSFRKCRVWISQRNIRKHTANRTPCQVSDRQKGQKIKRKHPTFSSVMSRSNKGRVQYLTTLFTLAFF